MNCPNCGEEAEGKFCTKCGASLSNVNPANSLNEENNNPKAPEINNNNNPNEQYQQQYNQNNTPQYTDNYNQANYNQNTPQYGDNYNQANYNPNRPQNQKSKAVGIILNIILVGLGYAYVGKWGEGIVIFIVYILCLLFSVLIIPAIIAVILWVYTLFKTNEMIDKYNAGLPY